MSQHLVTLVFVLVVCPFGARTVLHLHGMSFLRWLGRVRSLWALTWVDGGIDHHRPMAPSMVAMPGAPSSVLGSGLHEKEDERERDHTDH